jgi:hypothetical protein
VTLPGCLNPPMCELLHTCLRTLAGACQCRFEAAPGSGLPCPDGFAHPGGGAGDVLRRHEVPHSMRVTPALTGAALVVSLLGLPVAAEAHQPVLPLAQSGKADARNTWVVVHPHHHHKRFGSHLRLSGQVRYRSHGSVFAAAGVKVRLLRRPAGSGTWRRIGSDKTSHAVKPTYSFGVKVRGNADYRVVFHGNRHLQPSRKAVHLWVHRKLPAKIVQVTSSDLQLVGHVVPRYRHKNVKLQKRDCRHCSWHTIRHQRTNSKSHYSFDVGAPRSGSWFFRVKTAKTRRFARSYSATFRTFRP